MDSSTGIFGGHLLGVRTISGLSLYDWESLDLVRRIEIQARSLYWSESGHLLAIVTDESYYILKYDISAVTHPATDQVTSDGIENALEVSYMFI